MKKYLLGFIAIISSILYAVVSSNKRLKVRNERLEESLEVNEVTDKVTNLVVKEHQEEEASIEASTQALREKVNETNHTSTPLDPEYIRLLNQGTDTVHRKDTSS